MIDMLLNNELLLFSKFNINLVFLIFFGKFSSNTKIDINKQNNPINNINAFNDAVFI